MKDQDCYGYVQIGLVIRLFRAIEGSNTKDFTLGALNTFEKQLELNSFEVTLAYTRSDAYRTMTESMDLLENNDTPIGIDLQKSIQEQFTKIEPIIFSEASIKKIYVLPTRRFNTDYLLNTPRKLLADGVFEKLDDIAQHDIRSACKCLLFGEATASAFHILRATESVLKHYYFHHKKTHRLTKPMWNNMLEQLRAKTRNKPPTMLLNSLDLIRTAYRNPTQHPQATYEIDSAQDLFGVCLDVIGKMGSELNY